MRPRGAVEHAGGVVGLALFLGAPAGAPEAAFWTWFTANAPRVATIANGHEPIADELAARLQRVDPDLTFEVGVKDIPRELIVSAGGLKRAFPAVQRLVAAAPPISGWKVVAFRPRLQVGMVVDVGGYRVDPAQVWFKAERDGAKCGVTLFVPAYKDDDHVQNAAYLLLDHSLGEYDVETKVGFIDIRAIPRDPVSVGLRPLAELPSVVDRMVGH